MHSALIIIIVLVCVTTSLIFVALTLRVKYVDLEGDFAVLQKKLASQKAATQRALDDADVENCRKKVALAIANGEDELCILEKVNITLETFNYTQPRGNCEGYCVLLGSKLFALLLKTCPTFRDIVDEKHKILIRPETEIEAYKGMKYSEIIAASISHPWIGYIAANVKEVQGLRHQIVEEAIEILNNKL